MPGVLSGAAIDLTLEAEPGPTFTPPARAPEVIDWASVARDLAPIACDLSKAGLRRKSRDYFWFSPVLSARLDGVVADLIATPRDEAELLTLARYSLAHGLPLTARGGGTGNYGQAMPLHGGIVVDMTLLNGVKWLRGGVVRVGAGETLMRIEAQTRPTGWELRFHPSTWKTATIGGFVAGGSSGYGAINYGALSQLGNVLALRLLTLESEPRFIELRGAEARKAIHAYGTTGLITEVEMALAPAVRWWEFVVSIPDLMDAVRLSDQIARAEGIMKKDLAPMAWGAARYFDDLLPFMIPDQAVIIALIGEASLEPFEELVAAAGGSIVFRRGPDEPDVDPPPMFEFCWNHTTLRALKHDRTITYLQTQFDAPGHLDKIAHMIEHFGDEVPMHLEFARMDGALKCFGLQLVRFTSEARLDEIMQYHRDHGVPVFNPHTYALESGGRWAADPVLFAFKRQTDPNGLLNPGKMPGWATPADGFFIGATPTQSSIKVGMD
jgi:FAD/FMN-containing dehydrogenase